MNQQQQQQQPNLIITQGLAQGVVDYLVARPFREVFPLVQAMKQLGSHDEIVQQLGEATQEALAEQKTEHDAAAAELQARVEQLEALCKKNKIKVETAEPSKSGGDVPPKPGEGRGKGRNGKSAGTTA